ncbi:MlaD family protein [Spongiibacter tropicus]|uniref:PqiB family protein n=1 Tax=Spongiibacter tropicus TaxID=454602 RepID=UPI003A99D01C
MTDTDTHYPEANYQPPKRLSAVWLLPVVAAAIALWLLYQNVTETGLQITVHFDDGSGISAGKTPVIYQGITVGTVKQLRLNDKLDGVSATLELETQIEPLIRSNTQFWLVKPQISLSGVSGLDTLVGGNYISFQPGDGQTSLEFTALPEAPPFTDNSPGLKLSLRAAQLGSLTVGAPVLYQQIDVGDIEGYQLVDDGVEIALRIDPRYAHLVNDRSRFWNASGVRINAGLQGVNIDTGSLASVLAGGVAFDSPKGGNTVEDGKQFKLFENRERARGGRKILVHFPDAEGLSEGADVRLQGLRIGRIEALRFRSGGPKEGAEAELRINAPYFSYLNADSDFWLVKPQVSSAGIEGLDTLIGGPYISVRVDGEPGKAASQYTALREPPEQRIEAPGLRVVLKAEELNSVSVGSKVYYRKVAVGQVETVKLVADGVEIGIFIHQRYASLLHRESLFWNASGISVSGGLSGLNVKAESLATIVAGGIAFHTPEVKKPQAAWEGLTYTLHDDYESSFADKGREIRIYFASGNNLSKGTELKYEGIKVGEVTAVELDSNMQGVVVSARLAPTAKALARQGSRFWLIKPELGLVGTRNIETLLTGAYISVLPGSGETQTSFVGLERPPRQPAPAKGLNLVLSAEQRGSIKEGVKVYYRDIPVGEVFGVELSTDARNALIHINIEPRYATLVRANSRFWNASGVSVEFGLFSGAAVRSSSVESLIAGGIAFATPPGSSEEQPLAAQATSGQHYHLHKRARDEWQEWSPTIPIGATTGN